ncbi:DnaD domain protein [Ralstonia pickettii]|nr:DnaD domain protein [Ralstonia pickettii]
MQGYIKLYRKIMDSPVWSDPNYLKLWMYCLMKATHKEREVIAGNQVVTLEPGQFITGRESLSEDLNKGAKPKQKLSDSTWWRYLNNLKNWQMLHIKKTNKFSVVSIINWHQYQETEHQMNIKRTSDEHRMNTNKNVKNVNNDKELFSSNSEQEFSEVMKFYQENLQRGISESPFNLSLITQWFEEFGSELLLAAMKVAAKAEAKGVSFTEGVLKNWKEAGVKTLEDARTYQKQYKSAGKTYKNNVVQIPNYGGEHNVNGQDGKGDGQHSKSSRNVQLFK